MDLLIDNRTDLVLDEAFKKNIEKTLIIALDEAGYGQDYEISFSIVKQDEILMLNRDYRGIDDVTDVLSFPVFDAVDIEESGMLGDIVICYDRAKEQAYDFGHSLNREITYLTVHSLLHLLGYDHIKEDDKKEMRNLEKKIMYRLEVYKDESKGLWKKGWKPKR